ncbi:DNA cytosine methyltransferase [Planococcus beijingensis]|uniref:DNA cytosine methyltransferase n=1 Tax=Planococcus beijingensis TaxID=2782551 RepID=UPI00193B56DA|nr:DNA cytosine methyltransferase [Planococcus beijingensis]
MKKLNVLDLFAGAGGLSNGFEQTEQFKIKKAVELNRAARQTYIKNHENVEVEEDITKVKFSDSNGRLKEEYQDIDIVIGGPPCQGFSNANRQKNSLISNNNQLIKEYLRAIEKIKPTAFVMENVKNMNSKTHKFYLTSLDNKEELSFLKINVIKEKVNIGERTDLFDDLKAFIESFINKNEPHLLEYILKEEIFSKLNTVYRLLKASNINKADNFFEKTNNIKAFKKYLLRWESSHEKYWNQSYKDDWFKLKVLLEKAICEKNRNHSEIFYALKQIIENQKLLRKFQEIFQSNVVFKELNAEEESIILELYTYNVFDFLISKIKSLGYVINEEKHIFNAADYGVPQLRKRLVLIGVKKEKLKIPEVKIPDPICSKKEEYYSIFEAIADLESETPETDMACSQANRINKIILNNKLNSYLNNLSEPIIYNHVMTESTEVAKNRFKVLKEGQNFHDLDDSLKTSYSNHARTQNTIYRRLKYDTTSDTVVNIRKSMWVHPSKNRAISIREAARLQSFQDSYVFKGTKDQQYQQIGNAVPPLLARSIAESILTSLGIEIALPVKNQLKRETLSLAITGN